MLMTVNYRMIVTTSCNKEGRACKLYVMKTDQGVVKVKKLCNNAKLPVRGSTGAAGYDLAAAQTAVVPAHGKAVGKNRSIDIYAHWLLW